MIVRGVRGATTVSANDAEIIVSATKELFENIIDKNDIIADDVAQILISVTEELDAVFPAKALREFDGWSLVPVMCMKEIPVQNSLAMCIRVMLTINTEKQQDEIEHVYLHGAHVLRPDLSLTKKGEV